jgi:hypothetical protein
MTKRKRSAEQQVADDEARYRLLVRNLVYQAGYGCSIEAFLKRPFRCQHSQLPFAAVSAL